MIRINKCTKIVYLLWILAHFKRTTLMGNTWSRQDRGTKQFFNYWCKAGDPCSVQNQNIWKCDVDAWNIPSPLCSLFTSSVAGWRRRHVIYCIQAVNHQTSTCLSPPSSPQPPNTQNVPRSRKMKRDTKLYLMKQTNKNFTAPLHRVVNSQAGSLCMGYMHFSDCE